MILAPPHSNATVRRLSRARDMLCQALDQKLTLDRVAREAALSPSQFIRAFKAVFGQTPHVRTARGTGSLSGLDHNVTELIPRMPHVNKQW